MLLLPSSVIIKKPPEKTRSHQLFLFKAVTKRAHRAFYWAADWDWFRTENMKAVSCLSWWHLNPFSCSSRVRVHPRAQSPYLVTIKDVLMTATLCFFSPHPKSLATVLKMISFVPSFTSSGSDCRQWTKSGQNKLRCVRPGTRLLPPGPAGGGDLPCVEEERLSVHHRAPGWRAGGLRARRKGSRAGRR